MTNARAPNKSLQRSGTHKLLGRGRPGAESTRALRARVLKSQRAAAELGRYASLVRRVLTMTRQLLTNVAALTLILPTIVGAANPPDVKALFQAAISDIGRHGGIPVYVLTTVPQARLLDSKAVVTGGERRDGYLLSLYSERGNGPAGYIGGISGRELNSTDRELTPSKPQHEKRIKLPNGHLAIFHPVSCFGSCLAASLTWREFGAEYTLLFSLSPDTTESEQLRAMLELAKHLALGSENTDPRQ